MLTISSIAVAPLPQQATPVVRAQPVTPARPSNAVARESAAPAQAAPLGDAARAQVAVTPPLAPVTPPQEGQRADGQANAAAPERVGLPPADASPRAEGRRGDDRRSADATAKGDEDYAPVKNPAPEVQPKELMSNVWEASRAVVDLVIGEQARKVAAERAQKLEELHQRLNARPLANLPPGQSQQTYGAAGEAGGYDTKAGRQIDRLV